MSKLRTITKNQLDLYCIFLSSRWFESIDDYINLELVCSKYDGNMTKFFYNPISIDEKTMKLFSNLRTQYLYSKSDELIFNENIKWYNFVYKIDYLTVQDIKRKYPSVSDNMKFERIILTRENVGKVSDHYTIPEVIVELDDETFREQRSLTSIDIPTTVTKLETNVLPIVII